MEQTQRLKKVTEKLTNECWDLCVSNPAVSKLDSKTESCLVNCVERFLDTSQFILNEFSKKNQMTASSASFSDTESSMILDDSKFNEPIVDEKPKSGGFKFW